MSKLDTVRALIEKAGRLDTPIEEARTAALAAARMMVKEGMIADYPNGTFTVQDTSVPFPDDDYEVPDFSDTSHFHEVEPFKNEVAKHSMQCVKCGKEIRKGVVFTRETQTKQPRVTHYECRRYFTGDE